MPAMHAADVSFDTIGVPRTAAAATMPVPRVAERLQHAGVSFGRWSLVLLLVWYGAFKWTPHEADAIQPLIVNNPLTSWLTHAMSVQGASIAIGTVEILAALLLALRAWSPRLSALGSAVSIVIFTTTLSFLFTTPGVWVTVDGMLVPGGAGGFLIKDLLLLAVALVTAGEAWAAGKRKL
jgi:reactive chlorine resistance protein C